jgi:hypothetical protein
MTDIHIDDFYKDVAIIFLRLYTTFPRKTILYVDEICGADEPDEFGLHSERFLSGFSAMVWLTEHGYLKCDGPIKQEALDQAVLSEQGFLILSSRSELDFGDDEDQHTENNGGIPQSIMEHSKTNINQLRKAVKSQSSIMIRQSVHSLLNYKI